MSIKLEKIHKAFGKNTVLSDFSLTVSKGEKIALVSYSGSGKTTLFRIIAGLEKRFEGKREINGKIAYMFQEDRLFDNVSVLVNTTLLDDDKIDKAKLLLNALGLSDALSLTPTELSGGMKRRVALARALLFDSDIVLLDEPMTGLDPETAKTVSQVINEYTKEKTLLVITHSLDDAKLLDCKILNLEKGFSKK